MTTVLLVRHATTEATGRRLGGRTAGVHLDDAGRDQAAATARRLGTYPIAAVYASPLERTQETARAIARVAGLRVRTREGITEVDYGAWTDRPLGHLRRRKEWQVIQTAPSRFAFPGGESLRGMQGRAVDAVEALAAEHRDQLIVAVSHADVIKAVLAHYLGAPLDCFQRLVVEPASISTIHLAEGRAPVVARVNEPGPAPGGQR